MVKFDIFHSQIFKLLVKNGEGLLFSQITQSTGWSERTTSKKLKDMQREQVIIRDFETRRYRIINPGSTKFFLYDLTNFLLNEDSIDLGSAKLVIEREATSNFKKALVTGNEEKDKKDDLELKNLQLKLLGFFLTKWRNHILSEYSEKDQKEISRYEASLLKYADLYHRQPSFSECLLQHQGANRTMWLFACSFWLNLTLRVQENPNDVNAMKQFTEEMKRTSQVEPDERKAGELRRYLSNPRSKLLFEKSLRYPKSFVIIPFRDPDSTSNEIFQKMRELVIMINSEIASPV